MRPIIFFLILTSILLLIAPSWGLMVPLSIKNLIEDSDLIVIGTVNDIESLWIDNETSIQTRVTFGVNSVLLGNGTVNESIEILTRGGSMGDVHLWVEDEPVFGLNQTYGVFLSPIETGEYVVTGNYQGSYKLCNGELPSTSIFDTQNCIINEEFSRVVQSALEGDDPVISRDNFAFPDEVLPTENRMRSAALTVQPHISSISPNVANAGTGETVTIYGSGFGQKGSKNSNADVAFFFWNYWGDPNWIFASGRCLGDTSGMTHNDYQIVSWTDTQIVTKVPVGYTYNGYNFYPGSASSGPMFVITDDMQISNFKSISLGFGSAGIKWLGSDPKCTYYVNAPDSNVRQSIITAAETWNLAPGKKFNFLYFGNTYSNVIQYNGKNEIIWGNTYSPYALAEAQTWTTGDDFHGNIIEADIVYNENAEWSVNPNSAQYDIQTVALHELGHWLCLTDLYGNLQGYPQDTHKVMFGIKGTGEIVHSLSPEDIAGIRYIYPGVEPTLTVTLTPTTTTPIPTQTTPTPTTTIPTPTPTTIPTTANPDDVPPMELWGGVTEGGVPVPEGSIILAKISNNEKARISIVSTGRYGGSGAFDQRLTIVLTQADIASGYPEISFWMNGNEATQKVRFNPGSSQQLDLTFSPSVTSPTVTSTPTVTATVTPTPTTGPAEMTLDLFPGWNFVSTPKTLKDGYETAKVVFGQVNTQAHSIYRYDAQSQAWISLAADDPVRPLDGIWVYSAQRTQINLKFMNDPVQTPPTKQVFQGWNCIGFSDTTPTAARDSLTSIGNIWSILLGFDAEYQYYQPSIINGGSGSHSDTNLLYPGKGYWIFTNGPGTLAAIGV